MNHVSEKVILSFSMVAFKSGPNVISDDGQFLSCPAFRKVYATATDRPCLLRPWMLGFRADFGVSGFLDPEVGELLLQLILTEGSAAECQSAR